MGMFDQVANGAGIAGMDADTHVGMISAVERGDGALMTSAQGWVHPGAVRYLTAMATDGDVLMSSYGLPLRRLGDPATMLKLGVRDRPDRYLCFGIEHRIEARASRVQASHRFLHSGEGKMGRGRETVELKAPGLSMLSVCTLCPSLDMFQGQSLYVHIDDCTVATTAALLKRMAAGRLPAPGHWLAEEQLGASWYARTSGTLISRSGLDLVFAIPDKGEIQRVEVQLISGMWSCLKPGDRFVAGQQLYGVRPRRVAESAVAHSHEVLTHLEGVVLKDTAKGCLVSSAAVDQLRYRCTACMADGGVRVPNSVGKCHTCSGTMVPAVRAWWDCSRVGVRLAVPRGTHHEEVLLPEHFPMARALTREEPEHRAEHTA